MFYKTWYIVRQSSGGFVKPNGMHLAISIFPITFLNVPTHLDLCDQFTLKNWREERVSCLQNVYYWLCNFKLSPVFFPSFLLSSFLFDQASAQNRVVITSACQMKHCYYLNGNWYLCGPNFFLLLMMITTMTTKTKTVTTTTTIIMMPRR